MKTITRRAALRTTLAAAPLLAGACGDNADGEGDDLAAWDAVRTARAVRSGEIAAAQAVDAAIARAEAAEPELNAIVTPYFGDARQRASETLEGPWAGVPSFVKDLNNVTGQRTEFGSRAYRGHVARDQSDFVSAMLVNGVVSLGKSATPEFGLNATTEGAARGPTRNPWDPSRSAGGSSGGAAALVAAGVVPVAHASDGGGSIRIPASCCGLYGLKPSRGRMPDPERAAGQPIVLSEHGIVSRTVRDQAAFLAMMETSEPFAPVGIIEGARQVPLRIGLYTQSPIGTPVDLECQRAARIAADALAAAGHDIDEMAPPVPASLQLDFVLYWAAGAARLVRQWEERAGRSARYGDFDPWTFGLIEYYGARASLLEAAIGRMTAFAEEFPAIFGDYDLLLSPVLARPPAPIGELDPGLGFPILFERLGEYAPFTSFANVAGLPAMSVPIHENADGLPIGAQLVAGPGRERLLLEAAYQLEERSPQRERRPAIWGGDQSA